LLGVFVLVGPSLAVAEEKEPSWYLVQPLVRASLVDPLLRHYLKLLPQYLDGKVVVRETGRKQMLDRARSALTDERADRTAVLMAPLSYGLMHDEQLAMRSEMSVIPLQMVAKRPWCLAEAQDMAPSNRVAFMSWLSNLKRPVRIGLASSKGMPAIWIRAMERKTGLTWTSTDFNTSAEQGLASLLSGQQDLLLETCAELERMRALRVAGAEQGRVHILLSEQSVTNKSVATFAQWQLPTPAPSWLAWFVSSKMPQERRNLLGKAINAVTMREDTQALIRELGQEPMLLSVQASQLYVDNWLSNWKSISTWMNNLPDKAAAEPAGTSTPKKTGN
jgi:tripartite-type tricarboxylate transporter receptor subunit TctC